MSSDLETNTTSNFAFAGAQKVIGQDIYQYAAEKVVMIVGLGGVGSWTVEALARTGFKKLILVDLDEVCVSNTNRQLHTLTSTVGKLKTQVLKERVLSINPACEVQLIEDFISVDNVLTYLTDYKPDIIIDAIDSLSVKCALAVQAVKMQIPLLVAGAAGGKLRADKLQVSDLSQTIEDDLLHQMRKRLRQKHRFPRGKRKFKILSVYSAEPKPVGNKKLCAVPETVSGRLDCQGGLGSLCHVTGSMGFMLAQLVIEHFIKAYENQQAAAATGELKQNA